MSDLVLLLSGAISLVTVLLIILTALRRRQPSASEPRPRAVPVARDEGGGQPRRAARNVRARMRAVAARQQQQQQLEDDENEEEDVLANEIDLPEGKLGAKKRKKLEMKAEKRAQRERDLEEREERKQRQAALEEQRKREEQHEKEEEARREAEEKLLKEQKEKEELEEYMKLKEAFAVEEEGFDEADHDQESQNKLHEFISYIKANKVVLLEDLASHFRLKTQDCINRVQELLAQELLVGVIDDRGKFIYITKEELEVVAKFIRQHGRVSIAELVESSNMLINLVPESIPQHVIAV